jgi:hypothetical protein
MIMKRHSTRSRLRYSGAAILFVGLLAAELIYLFAGNDADMDAAAEIARGRGYVHNLEVMGGKFAMLSADFDRWFVILWHGRSLAYTVAVLAVVIAAGCFLVAHLMSPPSPAEPAADRKRG